MKNGIFASAEISFFGNGLKSRGLLLLLLAAVLSGCTPAPDDFTSPAVDNDGLILSAEVDDESELPTHWLNSESIGNSAGPVTGESLLKGLADTSEWLLYGGNYSNHRHSPITGGVVTR